MGICVYELRGPDCDLQVSVSGAYANNTAGVLGSFSVCNSTVYLVDAVLLPATSLAAIPQLNAANNGAAPAPGEACCRRSQSTTKLCAPHNELSHDIDESGLHKVAVSITSQSGCAHVGC